ncbi:MAG: L,D-transpeptidase, partial [Myxococcota bacterium]
FDTWLAAELPVADGFGAPLDRARRCGEGCWRVVAPSEVRAVAAGIVREVGPDVLVTEHLLYDDARRTVSLRWSGLTPAVAVGDVLARGQAVGTGAEVHLTGIDGIDGFFRSHQRLVVPQDEPVLAIVDRERHQLRLYVDGAAVGTFEVGLGQADGDKEQRGDNKTPRGPYRVVHKSTGPFDGDYADFYGGHWVKLSYPNPWDAARGVDQGWIGPKTRAAIEAAFWANEVPPQNTQLGSGIGLHGWIAEWPDDSDRRMSWG